MHLSPSSISPTESGERKRERERGVTIESCAKRSPCGLIVPSLGLDEARAGLIILLLDLNGTGQCGSRVHRLTSSQDWRCVQYAKVHPRTGVRTRRATGFWNRPLAGSLRPKCLNGRAGRAGTRCFSVLLQHEPTTPQGQYFIFWSRRISSIEKTCERNQERTRKGPGKDQERTRKGPVGRRMNGIDRADATV